MNKITYDNVYFSTWLVCLVTLPWLIPWNSVSLVLLAVVALAERNFIEKWRRLKDAPWIWPMLAFFGLHVFGLLYSTDMHQGNFEIEKKISFLVLPLIAASGPKPDAATMRRMNIGFVYSCLAIVLISMVFSYDAVQNGNTVIPQNFNDSTLENYRAMNPHVSHVWQYISYIQLGDWIDIHPAYFSMYLIFCCAILLNEVGSHRPVSLINVAIIVLFVGFIVLLSSRIAIVGFLVVITVLLYRLLHRQGVRLAVSLAVFVPIVFLLISINPVSRFRILQEPLVTSLDMGPTNKNWNSVNLRMLEWTASLQTIREKWLLGVGTGDGQIALNAFYSKFNESTVTMNYNAHNQYLQTMVELGLPGLLGLLICFFKPLTGATQHNHLLVCFILLFAIMCLTESMLERQKGIVFFTLFDSLLLRSEFQK